MLMHNPPHPGRALREFLADQDVTSFAEPIGVSRTTLSRLLHGHAGISAPMALRLAAILKTSPQLWMNLQMQYDLWQAMQTEKATRKAAKALRRTTPSVQPKTKRQKVSGRPYAHAA